MKYAILRILGKQYKVTEGQEILIDKANDPKLTVETLLLVDGEDVTIGKPVLKDAKVSFKIVDELVKGEKLDIYKFKAKSRYRKHTGFRPQYTRILVQKISN